MCCLVYGYKREREKERERERDFLPLKTYTTLRLGILSLVHLYIDRTFIIMKINSIAGFEGINFLEFRKIHSFDAL